LRLQSLPRCRSGPRADSARAAAVLGWCSPQSSVPRQTVGHHAKAAMYEMGPTAACEGCRGEVPRLFKALDILPTGACFFSLLIYPPTGAQWGARAGGLWGGFPNPAKLICMGFAKNGLASSQPHRRAPRTRRGAGSRAGRRRSRGSQQVPSIPLPAPAAALPAPFSYTHRPGRSGLHGPAGSGVDFPIPQNSFVWVALKMGSRARSRTGPPSTPPRPCPAAHCPEQAGRASLGRRGSAPGGLPYTPTGLPYTPRHLPYTSRPAYPGPGPPKRRTRLPRPAYPTPPRPRTLDPPRTAYPIPQPAYPRPPPNSVPYTPARLP